MTLTIIKFSLLTLAMGYAEYLVIKAKRQLRMKNNAA